MLDRLYVEALLSDKDQADIIWDAWNAGLIRDELAAAMWWACANGRFSPKRSFKSQKMQ